MLSRSHSSSLTHDWKHSTLGIQEDSLLRILLARLCHLPSLGVLHVQCFWGVDFLSGNHSILYLERTNPSVPINKCICGNKASTKARIMDLSVSDYDRVIFS